MIMEKEARWKKILGGILRYAIASISFSILLYVVFALLFSTEEEKQLLQENRLYQERYDEMLAQQRLIGDVVGGLMERDDAIYEELFETSAPSPDATTAADLIAASDSLSESFDLSAAASASRRSAATACATPSPPLPTISNGAKPPPCGRAAGQTPRRSTISTPISPPRMPTRMSSA